MRFVAEIARKFCLLKTLFLCSAYMVSNLQLSGIDFTDHASWPKFAEEIRKARNETNLARSRVVGIAPPENFYVRLYALFHASESELRALYPKMANTMAENFDSPCPGLTVQDPQHPNLSRAISTTYLLFGVFLGQLYPYLPVPVSSAYLASTFSAALKDCTLLPKTRSFFNMLLQLSTPFVSVISGDGQTVANNDIFDPFVVRVDYALNKQYDSSTVTFTWEALTSGASIDLYNPYLASTNDFGVFSLENVQATGAGTVLLSVACGNAAPPATFTLTITP